jgi:integrase
MAKSNQSRARSKAKPKKPRPDFPLFPHATGRWAKKVRGKFHYFGKCADDPKGRAALELWLGQKDDLLAGRQPRTKRDGLSVVDLCNQFLHAKKARVATGELAEATWNQYHLTCQRLANVFGQRLVEDLRGVDFDRLRDEFAKTNGLTGLRHQITHTRMVMKYAYDAELINAPVRFGADFSRPSALAVRRQRKERMFEADEIRRMIEAAGPVMKAMILLGVNGGLGNKDVETLPRTAVEMKGGWLTYPRPKTGAERRIPLWTETIDAIQQAVEERPKPASKELKDRVFLTRNGGSWHKTTTRYLTDQFRKFLQAVDRLEAEEAEREKRKPLPKLYRKGIGFYTLRHVFETIGGESRDQVAVDAIMGHERGDMASVYRERISDQRLRNVVETVRAWLYAEDGEASENEPDIILLSNFSPQQR